jgi:uncharacterized protein (DUF1800 family)
MSFSPEILSARFGYGLPLPPDTPTTPQDMLARLTGPDHMQQAYPLPLMAEHLPLIQNAITLKQQEKDTTEEKGAKAAVQLLGQQVVLAARATVARSLDASDGFRERLVAFWANHFATAAKDGLSTYLPALMVEEAIRPNLTGSFANLLIAATSHPAMVMYLDQNTSYGPHSPEARKRGLGLNENLGREVMELHSLGVAAKYTQKDVTQMALLLTGLTFAPMHDGLQFDPRRVEPGPKTVLGKTYRGDGLGPIHAGLTDLAARPETALHISTKLARHFIADIPPQPLVDAMTKAYLDTDGDLMAVYQALLTQPAASEAPLGKVRWPNDYIVTCFRAVGLGGSDVMALDDGPFRREVIKSMAAMGMPWFRPGGPNGFSEAAEAWINPPYLASRIAWSMTMPGIMLGTKAAAAPALDPRVRLDQVLGTRVSAPLRQAVGRAESQQQGLGLILASTEMNRR